MRGILFILILLLFLFHPLTKAEPIQKIQFIYKNKAIPFKEGPIITDREIYFSQEDFITLMKSFGFLDWYVTINKDTSEKILDCLIVSNDMPKFKAKFIPLVYEEKIYIPYSSIQDHIGISPIYDYEKGKIYFYPQIKEISVSQDSLVINGAKEIKIQKNFYLNNPLRFVVDLEDCVLSPHIVRQKILSSNEYIYQIRVSQFNQLPAIVRVVVELKPGQKVKTLARILPNQLQMVFSDRIPELYAKTSKLDYQTKEEEQVKIYQITPQVSGSNLSILISLDKPINYSINRLDNGKWYIDLYNTILTVSSNEIHITSDVVDSVKYAQNQLNPVPITRIVITPKPNVKINTSLDLISNTGKLISFLVKEKSDNILEDDFSPINFTGKVIVIDPGHGGRDSGAVNHSLSLEEKDITLKISQLTQQKLSDMGYKVILTRYGDYELTGSAIDSEELQARVNVGIKNKASIFVSVHINASTYSFANGLITFYNKDIDYPLAYYIHQEIAKTNIFDDKGIRTANFYVLRRNPLPSVLLEIGFISNYNDAIKLKSFQNLDKIASAIARGIHLYITKSSRNLD
ncbi:MAG: N-acetylmuramoyl-L-alanine amidase [bacterium]